MLKSWYLVLILVLLLGFASPSMAQNVVQENLVQNGSFEEPASANIGDFTVITPTSDIQIQGWTVAKGDVEWSQFWSAAVGRRSLELGGNQAGAVSQVIGNLVVGQPYVVSFNLSKNFNVTTPVSIRVAIDNITQDFTYALKNAKTNMLYDRHGLSFNATAETMTLSFESVTQSGGTGVIDDVRVTPNLVQNGSFEEGAPAEGGNRVIPNAEQGTSATDIVGWQVTSGAVDWLGRDSGLAAADGVRFVDVSASNTGTLEQTFNTTQCANYVLEFAMGGDTTQDPSQKDLMVSAGNTEQQFSYSGARDAWEAESMAFTAAGATTTLRFTSQMNSVYGPQIDNVLVYPRVNDIGFTQAELAGTTWSFERADGTLLVPNFVLAPDGSIGDSNSPNESRWAVETGTLVIYSADNIPSTCYTTVATEDGVKVLRGAYLLEPERNITHVLRRVSP